MDTRPSGHFGKEAFIRTLGTEILLARYEFGFVEVDRHLSGLLFKQAGTWHGEVTLIPGVIRGQIRPSCGGHH